MGDADHRHASDKPANVVESNNLSRSIPHNYTAVPSHLVLHIVSYISVPSVVGHEKPSPGENGSPFELVDLKRVIEGSRQGRMKLCRNGLICKPVHVPFVDLMSFVLHNHGSSPVRHV